MTLQGASFLARTDFAQARSASRAARRGALREPGHAGHMPARPWPGRRNPPSRRRSTTAMSNCGVPSISYALISCGKVYRGQRARNGEPERCGLILDALSGRLDLKNARGGRRTLRDAGQCEGLHARFRRHFFSDVVETAERNDGRHVATASRHDGRRERAWLFGLSANVHELDQLPGSDASRQILNGCSGSPAVTIDATPGTGLGLFRRRV